MTGKGRHDGTTKGRVGRSDLINIDLKTEQIPLKHEVMVKKAGGLFLSPTGVKVEIPPGASTGRRERLLCAPAPSSARGILAPWLGQNLRIASEMQLFYCQQTFRQPLALFIPFSYAAAREMTTMSENDPALEKLLLKGAQGGDVAPPVHEPTSHRQTRHGLKQKLNFIGCLNKIRPKQPSLLDTRSIFVLRTKIGEENWEIVKDFQVIQPTVHHTSWPHEVKRLVTRTTRWPDQSYVEIPPSTPIAESQHTAKRFSNTTGRAKRNPAASPQRDLEVLEQIRHIEDYCGGVCISTEDLNHIYVVVLSARAANFFVDRDGGLYRSPHIHPFFSVRIPKRSCMSKIVTNFKALDIRANWSQNLSQFDSQLSEIECCSDIYELNLSNIVLKRPATVHIPLPQSFIDKRTRSHENWDQTSTTIDSMDHQERVTPTRFDAIDGTYHYDKPLMLLYQPPGLRRQIAWQVAITDDAREEISRRKSRIQVSKKESTPNSKVKVDNPYCRLGWGYLTVGMRAGQWYVMKQPLFFTRRTAFFETNLLGKFVLIGARDPERTPITKLAHLMTRLEVVAMAPPGALLIFLQIQSHCWKVKAQLCPEDQVTDTIREHVNRGFYPLAQFASGPIRRTTSLCNSLIQAGEIIQLPEPYLPNQQQRKPVPVRLNGSDINHVLMFNGLCLELRFSGDIRMKSQNHFEPLTQAMKPHKGSEPEPMSEAESDMLSSLVLGEKLAPVKKRDFSNLLSSNAWMQQHELLHETACLVEIEPIPCEDNKYYDRCVEKTEYVTDLIKSMAKKTESTSDEDDDDDDDMDDDDDDSDGSMDTEEQAIGRRMRQSRTQSQSSTPYIGDDGEMDELTRQTQELVLKEQPLSAASVNAELLRRLNNVYEKGKINRATDLLEKVHNLYHMGSVEICLVPPHLLAQMQLPANHSQQQHPQLPKDKTADDKPTPPTTNADEPNISSNQEVDDLSAKEHEDQVMEGHNTEKPDQENHSFSPDEQEAELPDLQSFPSKPLVSYDILIDPDLVANYLRTPYFRPGTSINQKKVIKIKEMEVKQTPVRPIKQRNASSVSSQPQPHHTTKRIQEGDANDVAKELSLLDHTFMTRLAELVAEPMKLASALNLPTADYDELDSQAKRDRTDPNANTSVSLAYQVIKKWKMNCVKSNRPPTNGREDSGGSNWSAMNDLIDVFQSLAYFEAAEMLIHLKATYGSPIV